MRKFGAKLLKVGVLAAVGAGLIAFQNCSSVENLGSEDPNSLLSEDMPFSYDAKIDQIAYMSCSGLKDNIDTDTYFTIRAGAYRDGGLKLKDEFFQDYSKKTPERMSELLNNSPLNSNTVLQLAVRQRGSLNSLVTSNGTPKQGVDFANLLLNLGTAEMSSHLIKTGMDPDTAEPTGKRTKAIRMGNGVGARLEGTLRFGDSESLASSLRDSYLSSGKGVLALTYAQASGGEGPATDARSEMVMPNSTPNSGLAGGATDRVFGMSYAMTFGIPAGAKGFPEFKNDSRGNALPTGKEIAPHPTSWLMMVQEGNLAEPTEASGSWVCPANLRFRIIRTGDDQEARVKDTDGTVVCVRKPDPDLSKLSKEEALRVQIARNSLRVEDWYVDFSTRGPNDGGCIIPKKNTGSCYGESRYVRYNYTALEGCDPNSKGGSGGTNSLKSSACLAWVSICYRQ